MTAARQFLLSILFAVGCAQAAPAIKEPAVKAAAAPAAPRAPTEIIGDVDLREVRIQDLARLAAELAGVNVVATTKAADQLVTVFLRNTTVKALIDNACRIAGLWYRHDAATNTYLIMTADEFQRDVVVYRADYTRVLTLKHHNVVSAANAIRALYGSRVTLTEPVEEGLAISALGSPMSSQRKAAGGGQTQQAALGGQAGQTMGRGGAAGAAGGNVGNVGAAGSREVSPGGTASAAGRGAASLANLSLERIQTVAGATEGTVTRIAGGELEKLDQTREPPIYVTFNRLHNFLLLRTGDEAALKEIEALVTRLDKPARQVLLEMKVLELTKGDDFASAFDLDYNSRSAKTGPASAQASNPVTGASGAAPKVIGGLNPFTQVNPGAAGLFQLMNERIRLRLQLLQSENRVNVLATPMLLASNNQPSRLFIGEERVLTTGASASQTTNENSTSTLITVQTEKRDVGNTLIIVPRINDDRTISLSIDQDSSEIVAGGGTVPVGVGGSLVQVPVDVVNTANLQSTVLAKNGLTVAIGGMIRVAKSHRVDKLPLLGDIPGLGFLFRNETESRDKSEVVLLITPHILDTPEEGEARSRERLAELLGDPRAELPRLMPAREATSPTTPTPIERSTP